MIFLCIRQRILLKRMASDGFHETGDDATTGGEDICEGTSPRVDALAYGREIEYGSSLGRNYSLKTPYAS